jgi:hypothetical protein
MRRFCISCIAVIHKLRLRVLQLVPLDRSSLKGASINIPSKPFDLDPDWEVDPDSLQVGAKIGASVIIPRRHSV